MIPLHISFQGLSPRGRGNPDVERLVVLWDRSIPAWAGEPPTARLSKSRLRVYPRVGGGTARVCDDAVVVVGLSPRGRGNPLIDRPAVAAGGSIPAWAGEPLLKGG